MDIQTMKDAIDKMVEIIKEAIATLKAFIDGFKKTIIIGVGDETTEISL